MELWDNFSGSFEMFKMQMVEVHFEERGNKRQKETGVICLAYLNKLICGTMRLGNWLICLLTLYRLYSGYRGFNG